MLQGSERKVCYIADITEVKDIKDADRIEIAVINSCWTAVVNKGQYKAGDSCIYCEIDAFVPSSVAPFLTAQGKFPKEYLGVKGEKIKTKKLKGVLSQGLVLPLSLVESSDTDPQESLGIVKYEAPQDAKLQGNAKGSFPSLVPKTDQERVQNLAKVFEDYKLEYYEVTEKIEGSSMTCFLDYDGNFEVCSRNLSLKREEVFENNCTFWKVALLQDIENKMKSAGLFGYAIQGELIGEGIQGNIYKLKGWNFLVYDIYDVKNQKYLDPYTRKNMVRALCLEHVPVLYDKYQPDSIEDSLYCANGVSELFNTNREGIVFKSNTSGKSFKAISNEYLLKQKD